LEGWVDERLNLLAGGHLKSSGGGDKAPSPYYGPRHSVLLKDKVVKRPSLLVKSKRHLLLLEVKSFKS